ncbi:glutaminyl-peptide cyclotransferase [Mucilaginibacter glaciei]|uniref:Glutaminyl-peptide cyclotransferase n=1 Tax=Mucilaginibacter glaciei TaxID=2772109 RepID=A0A926S1I2_9SPHI|nr:glutaminyl-peptide cyclotransferase [Mucilaginibacter glaciei]MBD1392832.1 glutaminyl-peptide cyclotransferase [Mucilaginibacter glaciei]
MNKRIAFFALIAALAYGCTNNDKTAGDITISPDAGTSYKSGDVIAAKVNLPGDIKPDSVVYLLDSTRVGSAKDSSVVKIKTDSLGLGARVITAKVYQGGKSTDVTTNVVLLSAKAPEELSYTVEKTFPHDTASYTEGLQYADGVIYESDGGVSASPEGRSSLRKADLNTGKVLKIRDGDPKIFSEGLSVVGDKIVQLTWTEKIGYVYDKKTFEIINKFNNNVGVEGWGLCFDGTKLYMDDSTNRIWFLDKDKFNATGFIDVYDDKGPINKLNEMEYINGLIYANVYETDDIVVINPKTGSVLQRINMANIYPLNTRPAGFDNDNNVLNGIAYDKATSRIFVTGKKWPKMYQVKFVKK